MQKVASDKEKKDLLKEYISFLPTGYKFENETAKKVFAVLYFYSHLNNHQPFTIGQRQIADESLLSQMTVSRAMKLLIENYKYVECQKGHLKVNSTYQILSPSTETSIETSIETSTETLNKNDMFQQSQNVSTKLIDDVSITCTDNEQVTGIENVQMFQCVSEGSQSGMFHNNNNNNNFNNKFNNSVYSNMVNKKNSVYSNKSINLKEMELISKLLERIEVLESNQSKTTLLIENLFNNFSSINESKENEKVLQLEEVVEKQAKEITHLNERLDKAGKLFVQLRKSVYTSTSTVGIGKENTTNNSSNIENSKNSTISTSTTSSGKSEYIQAIDKFYKSKNSKDFEKAEEALNALNSLVEEGKLNDYQIGKVADCKKYFEEEKAKGTTNNTTNIDNNFCTLQNNFYKTLNGKEEDKFESLTTTLKELEELKVSDSKQKENLKKIEEIYVKTLGGEVRSYYFKEFIAYRNVFKVINQKGDKDKLYELAKRFCAYLNTLKNVSKTLLKGGQLEQAVNYENGLWDNEITTFKKDYEKKASLSLQNEDGGTTVHTEEENRSESLKSGENGVISIEVGTQKPQKQVETRILSKKSPVNMDSVNSILEKDMKEILNNKNYKL